MIENWTNDLIHSKAIDFYYNQIKDWYTPKIENKLFPNKKVNTFYLTKEPYDCDN
jgi:hypothetical protein